MRFGLFSPSRLKPQLLRISGLRLTCPAQPLQPLGSEHVHQNVLVSLPSCHFARQKCLFFLPGFKVLIIAVTNSLAHDIVVTGLLMMHAPFQCAHNPTQELNHRRELIWTCLFSPSLISLASLIQANYYPTFCVRHFLVF